MSGDSLEPFDPTGDGFNLDLAVSALASNSTDVGIMMKLLVNDLSSVLGSRLVVERRGGILRRSDEVKSVEVHLGDDVLRAELEGGTVRCTVGHSSGGIRIRSERVEMDQWLKRLLGVLQAEAAQSEATRRALENLMIGGDA